MGDILSKQIIGDPEQFINVIISEKQKNIDKKLEEAHRAAVELLTNSFRQSLEKNIAKISEFYTKIIDKIRSAEALHEAEKRLEISRVKNKWINKLLEEVRSKIIESRGSKEYEKIIEGILKKFLSEAKDFDELVLYVCPADYDIVSRLIEELRPRKPRLKLAKTDKPILGGFLASTPDGKIWLNYSLDVILDQMEPTLRRIADISLFGG